MIVTGETAATLDVAAVNAALVAPAATVTLFGTAATLMLLLVSETSAPPDGAVPVSDAVPVEEFPPVTDAGFTLTPLRDAGPLADCCGGGKIGSIRRAPWTCNEATVPPSKSDAAPSPTMRMTPETTVDRG